jgi:hypothetical protein
VRAERGTDGSGAHVQQGRDPANGRSGPVEPRHTLDVQSDRDACRPALGGGALMTGTAAGPVAGGVEAVAAAAAGIAPLVGVGAVVGPHDRRCATVRAAVLSRWASRGPDTSVRRPVARSARRPLNDGNVGAGIAVTLPSHVVGAAVPVRVVRPAATGQGARRAGHRWLR